MTDAREVEAKLEYKNLVDESERIRKMHKISSALEYLIGELRLLVKRDDECYWTVKDLVCCVDDLDYFFKGKSE